MTATTTMIPITRPDMAAGLAMGLAFNVLVDSVFVVAVVLISPLSLSSSFGFVVDLVVLVVLAEVDVEVVVVFVLDDVVEVLVGSLKDGGVTTGVSEWGTVSPCLSKTSNLALKPFTSPLRVSELDVRKRITTVGPVETNDISSNRL